LNLAATPASAGDAEEIGREYAITTYYVNSNDGIKSELDQVPSSRRVVDLSFS
jgi:hypothetical protein